MGFEQVLHLMAEREEAVTQLTEPSSQATRLLACLPKAEAASEAETRIGDGTLKEKVSKEQEARVW